MGSHVLLTADPKAFNYVMKNNYECVPRPLWPSIPVF